MPEWTAVTGYLVGFAALGVIYAVLAVGLNIQWGYTGLFNIGIAGFTAVGAYTSALLTSLPASSEYVQYVGGLSLPFPVGLVGAAVFCGLLAFLVGIPTLRLREDYLAIVTIGIAEVLRQVLVNERWLANGTRGLIGIPQPLRGLVPSHLYDYLYLGLGALVLVAIYLALERAIRSPWGRVLKAIREDETAALAAGKDTFRFRLQAFIVGAMVMGIGGALYTHFIAALTPDSFQPLRGGLFEFPGVWHPTPLSLLGQMLSGVGLSFMYMAPWMAVWPRVALSLAVFGLNMFGDALRDLLDPRLRGTG